MIETISSLPPIAGVPTDEIPRSALGSQVAARLRESILRGHYSPGDPLPETQLAEAYAVSRGPIRDALVELEAEGLVSLRPHRTARVASLTREDVEELYSLRLALETLAVRWAARRATENDFSVLDDAVRALGEQAGNALSEHTVARTDLTFHDAIYRASHHGRLIRAWTSVRSQIYLFLLKRNLTNSALSEAEWTRRLVSDHGAILETLRARDEEGAVRLVEPHLREPYLGLLNLTSSNDDASTRRGE